MGVRPAVGGAEADLGVRDWVATPWLVALVEGCLQSGGVGIEAGGGQGERRGGVDAGDALDAAWSPPCGLVEAESGCEPGAGLGDSDGVLAGPGDSPAGGAEIAA